MKRTDKVKLNNSAPLRIADRYLVKRRLGEGGMGHVYLAEDTHLMRQVAIKTIRPELKDNDDVQKRIDRECKLHAAIRIHPHIVALHDRIVDKNNNVSLVMEYVEGETLLDCIATAKKNKQEIPVELIVAIILQVLDALGCIHRHGIIHRDIKPSNIIVGGLDTDEPYAKLMDFGIARDVIGNDNLTRLTMVDAGGPGTPAYMAPERIDSKTYGEICPATDLYSVGIILYELFYKEPPFQGTLTEVFSGHLARPPEFRSFSLIPVAIRNVIAKALEKNVADRYGVAQQFAAALASADVACGNETLVATSFDSSSLDKTALYTDHSLPLKSASAKLQKKITAWGICVTGLIVLAVFVSSFLLKRDPEGPPPTTNEEAKEQIVMKAADSSSDVQQEAGRDRETVMEAEQVLPKENNEEGQVVENKTSEDNDAQNKHTSGAVKNEDAKLRKKNAATQAFDGARASKQLIDDSNVSAPLPKPENEVEINDGKKAHVKPVKAAPRVATSKPAPTPPPRVEQKLSPVKRSGDFVEVPSR